jgi:methyl-accepting chemotaxis protein
VEQVNAAISDVAQSTNETEVGSRQTFETASQLTTLSRELGLLVEPQAVV